MLSKYQKLTDKEHILKKPDTYIGSIEESENETYIFDESNNKIVEKTINYIPALYKLFDDESLHDYLLSEMITLFTQPINIESNGKQVFYFWDGFDFVLERFPEVLRVLKRFHEKYFLVQSK